MSPFIKILLLVIWGTVVGYWLMASIGAKKSQAKESLAKRLLLYWLPPAIAVYLLGPGDWFGHTWLRENYVPHTNTVGIIGLAVCLLGAIIACWARYLLGKNWSISVQKKEEHELISSGPYAWVRHPIYTGLILLFLGTAIIVGDWRGLIAVAFVSVSFWFKLKKEEQWMSEAFGEKYGQYRQKTKALIPFLL